MSESLLPLFPLQVVLFPHSTIPLHIFEERYKVLIKDCLAGNKEFGVNLAVGTEIAAVGCTAIVTQVTRMYDDGRMDIAVEGQRRYRLESYEQEKAAYLTGKVNFIRADEEPVNMELAIAAVALFNELVGLAFKGEEAQLVLTADTPGLSYLIAQKAGLELQQRQLLLETPTENERLALLQRHLSDLLPKVRRAEFIERLVRNDGYLHHSHLNPEDE